MYIRYYRQFESYISVDCTEPVLALDLTLYLTTVTSHILLFLTTKEFQLA